MNLVKRIYNFIIKLFSIKVALFIIATWALNDRNIGSVISMPCTRHKRGDMDEIWVSIQLGEEA